MKNLYRVTFRSHIERLGAQLDGIRETHVVETQAWAASTAYNKLKTRLEREYEDSAITLTLTSMHLVEENWTL